MRRAIQSLELFRLQSYTHTPAASSQTNTEAALTHTQYSLMIPSLIFDPWTRSSSLFHNVFVIFLNCLVFFFLCLRSSALFHLLCSYHREYVHTIAIVAFTVLFVAVMRVNAANEPGS